MDARSFVHYGDDKMFDQVKLGGAEEDFDGVGPRWLVSARGWMALRCSIGSL